MADGMQNLPDLSAQMAQAQAARNANASAGKPIQLLAAIGAIFGINMTDADVGASLSCKGKGLNCDAMINRVPQGRPGKADKLLQAYASIGEDLKNIAKGAGVMYSGDLPSGSLPGGGGGAPRSGGGGMDLA